VFVLRLLDKAGAATVQSGVTLTEAWSRWAYPAKLVSPWGPRGEAALRVVDVAFADADVAGYGRSGAHASRAPVAFDPVWNRTRAVYQYRSALFAPAPAKYDFAVELQARELRAELAAPPGTGEADVDVLVDGEVVLTRHIERTEQGRWLPVRVVLPDRKIAQISFATRGTLGAPVLVANPMLVGGGNPGLNVVTVVIDTLRADALPVMPRLQGLIARGAWFRQAVTAATWTRPSLLALFGGDLPAAIGQSAEDMIPSESDRRRFYASSPPLLPRLLAARGYLSTAIGNNFFLLGYPQIGLDLGFDEVDDVRHPVLDTPAISAAAVQYLRAHAREAFFLHLHFDAPHWPYTPPPEYLRKVKALPDGFPADSLARQYLAEAAYADEHLGKVLDEIDRLGLGSRTVIVVLGDHGEIFDAAHAHTVDALKLPTLHHHGWSAYDEILRVPLVIAGPGVPTKAIDAQVRTIDILPTLYELLGLGTAPARGRSLMPLVRGAVEPERPAFVEGQEVRALRADGWLYLRRRDGRLTLPNGKHVDVDEELYSLAADPGQHKDVAASEPEALAKMRARFEREAPVPPPAPAAAIHLVVAPDDRPHLVTGVLRSDGGISVLGISGGEAVPVDAHSVRISLRDAARVDVALDPAGSRLTLQLERDGIAVGSERLLVGPFALPLFASAMRRPQIVVEAAQLGWLDAVRQPPSGTRGEISMWRDPGALLPSPVESKGSTGGDDVATMMRRWGYAK
jgi:arylsulfatase A-like enzyme